MNVIKITYIKEEDGFMKYFQFRHSRDFSSTVSIVNDNLIRNSFFYMFDNIIQC